jgi:PAS domain S-box-containing protein
MSQRADQPLDTPAAWVAAGLLSGLIVICALLLRLMASSLGWDVADWWDTALTAVVCAMVALPVFCWALKARARVGEVEFMASRLVDERDQATRRYALVLNATSDLMVVLRGKDLVFANPAARASLPLPNAAGQEMSVFSFVPEQYHATIAASRRKRKAGEAIQPYEIQVRDRQGALTWVLVNSSLIEWDKQAATLIVMTRIDELKRLSDAVASSEKRYRTLVEEGYDAIIVEREDRFIFLNRAAENILAHPMERLLSQQVSSFLHPDDVQRSSDAYTQRLSGKTVPPYELRWIRADGQQAYLLIKGVAIEWEGEPACQFFVTDITARKASDQAIRDALDRERELSNLKTRFVSMASHELRTPLASIQSSAELLAHYADRLGLPERERTLADITAAVGRMETMLEEVLLLGRIEAGRMNLRLTALDLPALLVTLLRELEPQHRAKSRTDLSIALDDSAPPLLDENLVRHVMSNLLVNAAKYSASDSRIEVQAKLERGTWHIAVQDHGIGIPQTDLPRLFEGFHRAGNVGTISGTGLGLSIVKRALEALGGEIRVNSTVGQGTRFEIQVGSAQVHDKMAA